MAVLKICTVGDNVLRDTAVPVTKIDHKIRKLLSDMAETMYAADGVGLAASQVGVLLRITVVDDGNGLVELINPVIIEREGNIVDVEGCLSVPGMFGEVERAESVVVEALNRKGKKFQLEAEGLLAKAIQHELDHFEGILFIDKAKTIHKG